MPPVATRRPPSGTAAKDSVTNIYAPDKIAFNNAAVEYV